MDIEVYNREPREDDIADWQRALAPGDKIVRVVPIYDFGLVVVYGELLEPTNPKTEKEPEYRFGRFYSKLCPGGSYGLVHLSQFYAKLSDEGFQAAKQAGWPGIVSNFNLSRGN